MISGKVQKSPNNKNSCLTYLHLHPGQINQAWGLFPPPSAHNLRLALQLLKLVVVAQEILLKYSPMKKMLEKLSFVFLGPRILRVLWQFFCDCFRFQFHSDSVLTAHVTPTVLFASDRTFPSFLRSRMSSREVV